MHLRGLNKIAAYGDARAVDTRRPSRAVWENCPWYELAGGLKDGFAYFDDLLGNCVQAANVAAASTTLSDPFAAFTNATAGATVASDVHPTDATGAVVLNSTTAQEGVHLGIHTAKNTTGPIESPSVTNRIWFEARVKPSSITNTELGFFVGLMKYGREITLGTMATGGGAVAAVDHIGFIKMTASTPAVVQTSVGDGTSTIVNATPTGSTLVAATYVDLGFYWDGNVGTFFINGVPDSKTLTTTSTQFPTVDNLCLMIGMMAGAAGTAQTLSIDWVKYAFERVK